MEEVSVQCQPAMNIEGSVVLDIESLTQPHDKHLGSPLMTKALSRKGSSRTERRSGEEQETDEAAKKIVVKVVSSQLDQLKQLPLPNKVIVATTAANSSSLTDAGDGRIKRLNRITTIHPRKILLLFATMSSMGTMILIYFTLAINRRGRA